MISIALLGLENAINQYLKLDPDTTTRLATLSDKTIEMNITDWNIRFYVKPTDQGVHLVPEISEKPDTIINGKLFALIRVGYQGANSRALFKNAIDISGDTHTGEALRDAFQKIDIDWEEHLSRFTGDSFAHMLAYHTKKVLEFGSQTLNKIKDNVKEYIHFEVQYFPTSKQIERFYRDVSELRNDVDRLEARLARLQKTPIKKTKKRAQ